jgi:hypothetical protein
MDSDTAQAVNVPALIGQPLAVDTWTADQPRFPKLRETIDVVDPGLKVHDRKLFNVLLAHSYEFLRTDPNRTFAASATDLKRAIGWSPKKTNTHLNDSLRRLQQTLIVIGYNSNGKLRRRNLSLLITSDVPFSEGTVFWRFHPELAPYLANPTEYAMIYLTVSAKFTSGYALRLYELLAMRVQSGEMSWAVDIDSLRMQLGATEVSYDHIASLHRKVLAPALAEINDYAPFNVKVERQTAAAGRGANKVTGLVFNIMRDPERVIEVTTMTAAPRVQFFFDLHTNQISAETSEESVSDAAASEQADRVLRRRDALASKYRGWPLNSLAKEWGRDMLTSGKDTKRPFEAFEMWLSYRFGHLFRNGEPQPVSSPDQVTSWITTPELDRAGRSALAMRPAQRRQWVHAARHQDETVDVERMDPIEFHRWVPLIARDLLLRG